MASACLGKPAFELGVVEFADLNAGQNERHHVVLAAVVKSGPVVTEAGV